jgi:hypothetical protein
MNTLRLGKEWMKAERLSTFTRFTTFLPHVSLPIWNQEGAVLKGSLIFLYSKGFSPAWILLGQTSKGEWRPFHIHCALGSSLVRTLTWSTFTVLWGPLVRTLTWSTFTVLWGPLVRTLTWWVEQQLPRKVHPHTLHSKYDCLWSGKCYLEQKQSRHKILSHILCIHKASQCECAIAAWAWPLLWFCW